MGGRVGWADRGLGSKSPGGANLHNCLDLHDFRIRGGGGGGFFHFIDLFKKQVQYTCSDAKKKLN